MARGDFLGDGAELVADFLGMGTSGREGAAGWRMEGAGHFSLQHDAGARLFDVGIGDGDGREERLRVGMQGIFVEFIGCR